ncbi:unnamed protein product [Rhodiola kirilowii]
MMGDVEDKITYFQAITGLQDPDLCTEILQAHGWDLQLAISSFTSNDAADSTDDYYNHHYASSSSTAAAATESAATASLLDSTGTFQPNNNDINAAAGPGLAWKLITIPISVISASLGLLSGAIGLGIWAAGGVLRYSLGVGSSSATNVNADSSAALLSVSPAASEDMDFVDAFERDYGSTRPAFLAQGFMDALQRSRTEFKLLFVYLHSPDHPDTHYFCQHTLCSELMSSFVNENFVSWGGSIRASEGFKMSNSLKASHFPFCAVLIAATNQRIALLQQVEGPRTADEMVIMLQRVLEESSPVLVSARLEAEERRNNMRLREEQDAAYRAALEADQARERQRREEREQAEKEAAEAERKLKEEEEARERAAHAAAEREAQRKKMLEEKAKSLGAEPEKGPNVTQVLIRFPMGERKERRFNSDATIQTVYNFVDTLDCLNSENYSLVSNFPRVVYGQDKLTMSLKKAGLHPQASLFVELNS